MNTQWRPRGSSLPKPSLLRNLRETRIKSLNYHVNRIYLFVTCVGFIVSC